VNGSRSDRGAIPLPEHKLPRDVEAQDAEFLAQIDRTGWAYTTRAFAALEHRFVVSATDAALGRLIDDLYRDCASPKPPLTHYRIAAEPGAPHETTIFVDGVRTATMSEPSRLLRFLVWHINYRVITRSERHVLLHAAAASTGELGCLLAGRPDAGKTTLAAGLVRAGLAYLTDEAAAIDPQTLLTIPYPKPLSIDPGSWSLFPSARPDEEAMAAGYFEGHWLSPAAALGGRVSDPVEAALVVFPRYEPGSVTRLQPLRASEALVELVRHTFSFLDRGPRNLEVLSRVLRHAPAYAMVSGHLESACEAIMQRLDALGARR
jgi:hypothetical protein